jgi:hypothetical protein
MVTSKQGAPYEPLAFYSKAPYTPSKYYSLTNLVIITLSEHTSFTK